MNTDKFNSIISVRPQNLCAHREDISSRQAAKNAKDSAALFGKPIDGAGNSMLHERLPKIEQIPELPIGKL